MTDMIVEKELNIYKENSSRVKLVKILLLRTCIFFFVSYIIFHFINDQGGLSKVNKLLTLLNEEKILLAKKESILENKNNIIAQIRGPNKDLDLIDQLIRLELGFSDENEIVILDSPQ